MSLANPELGLAGRLRAGKRAQDCLEARERKRELAGEVVGLGRFSIRDGDCPVVDGEGPLGAGGAAGAVLLDRSNGSRLGAGAWASWVSCPEGPRASPEAHRPRRAGTHRLSVSWVLSRICPTVSASEPARSSWSAKPLRAAALASSMRVGIAFSDSITWARVTASCCCCSCSIRSSAAICWCSRFWATTGTVSALTTHHAPHVAAARAVRPRGVRSCWTIASLPTVVSTTVSPRSRSARGGCVTSPPPRARDRRGIRRRS